MKCALKVERIRIHGKETDSTELKINIRRTNVMMIGDNKQSVPKKEELNI